MRLYLMDYNMSEYELMMSSEEERNLWYVDVDVDMKKNTNHKRTGNEYSFTILLSYSIPFYSILFRFTYLSASLHRLNYRTMRRSDNKESNKQGIICVIYIPILSYSIY